MPIVITGPGRTTADRWTPEDASLLEEIPPCVPVYRIPTAPPSVQSDRLSRWLGLSSEFARWWVPSAIELGEEAAAHENPVAIFATMSPFESAEVAACLSKNLALPWIADLRDPWALDETQIFPTWFHRKAELNKMRRLLLTTSAIIMNTPEAVKRLRRKLPELSRKRIVCITNGFDSEDFSGQKEERSDRKFRIVHSGYLHSDMGLRLNRKKLFYRLSGGTLYDIDISTRSHIVLFKAIERWVKEDPLVEEDLEIVLGGVCSEEDISVIEQFGFSKLVHPIGYIPHRSSVDLVGSADLLFLPMHDLPPGERAGIVPCKTYEYMASGRPILAAVPEGDARDFIGRCGTGFICRSNDEGAMVQTLKRVHADWKKGKNSSRVDLDFVGQFERKRLTQLLARVFRGSLGQEFIAVAH